MALKTLPELCISHYDLPRFVKATSRQLDLMEKLQLSEYFLLKYRLLLNTLPKQLEILSRLTFDKIPCMNVTSVYFRITRRIVRR